MSEPRPIASLTSTLLARKGMAKPAMRPQNYSFTHTSTTPPSAAQIEDLGWNDMGHDHEAAPALPVIPVPIHEDVFPLAAEPVIPQVVEQQERLSESFPATMQLSVAKSPKAPRAIAGSKGKAAFTLRLDAERHLRLRLVCAVNHRSAQQIVTLALDEFLARQPDNAQLMRLR